MGLIRSVRGHTPHIGNDCFIAENATIIGNVTIGDQCSIWYQTVLRGDVHQIKIGNRCNIQDGAVLHCSYNYADTILADDVSIGHKAIIHGCHIGRHVLIGMGAIIMDKVVVQDEVIVAAGAVVSPGMVLESGYIYAGIPAQKMKPVSDIQRDQLLLGTARNYIKYSQWYLSEDNAHNK